MKMYNYIKESIVESISLKNEILSTQNSLDTIAQMGNLIFDTLQNGGKILICGNGGSASDAQHLAAEFVGRFSCERISLPAIALTTDTSILTAVGNDYGFDKIFSRQIEGLASSADILFAITTSGNSENVVNAINSAKAKGVKTIALLGGNGGVCKQICDVSLVVNSSFAARIQEVHILIGHILCGIIDKMITENE